MMVDGVIYVSTAWSKVKAFDAKSGKALWSFDPQVPGEWAVNACCDVVNRGVAVWEGKVFVDPTRVGGGTVIAAYSPRVRPGVPVSFPIAWDDLGAVTPRDYTVHTAIDALGDRV